jgi:hypothetical protein
MKPRAKTSSREQGTDFDIVRTREWLSYLRPSGVKRLACWSGSSPIGCMSIRVAATLSVMSGSLSLQSSHSMFGVLLVDSMIWIWICSRLSCIYFTFGVDFCQCSACSSL